MTSPAGPIEMTQHTVDYGNTLITFELIFAPRENAGHHRAP